MPTRLVEITASIRAVAICRECGQEFPTVPIAARLPDPICGECAPIGRRSAAEEADERAEKRRALAARWHAEGVPDCYASAGVDVPHAPNTARHVARMLDALRARRNHPGLLLFGSSGTGKTHLTYGIVNTLVADGVISPQRITHGSEARLLGSIANASPWEREGMQERLLTERTEALLLDDFGGCTYPGGDDMRRSLMLDLLDRLARRNLGENPRRPVLLMMTTNLPVQSLPTAMGAAAFNRLMAMVGSQMFETGLHNWWRGTDYPAPGADQRS